MQDDDFISKTQRKRQMLDIQDVGKALTKLSNEELARMTLPENLREAVVAARKFTKHEAIRRQLQYIGRIMRDLDVAPIAEQIAAIHAPSKRDTALFHRAEQWRTDLMKDPKAMERFLKEFPEANTRRLQALADAANAERDADRAPKFYRELFHAINTLLQEQSRRNR
jgi:ribosome-associated protein